jgi:hypothetical protein
MRPSIIRVDNQPSIAIIFRDRELFPDCLNVLNMKYPALNFWPFGRQSIHWNSKQSLTFILESWWSVALYRVSGLQMLTKSSCNLCINKTMPLQVSQCISMIDLSFIAGTAKVLPISYTFASFSMSDSLWETHQSHWDVNPRNSVRCLHTVDFETRIMREIWRTEPNV